MSAVPSLRDRQRLRAMQDIRHAAIELFLRQGYEETTIEQIAEAAGVSQRTFFRYFESKIDVLFWWFPGAVENLTRVLADRSKDPLQVLESTFAAGPWTTDHEFCDAFERIVAAEPSLRAHRQYLEWDFERVVSPYIAKRFGLDERRAALVTGALFGAIRAARECGAAQVARGEGRLMGDAFRLVEPLVQAVREQSRRRIGAR